MTSLRRLFRPAPPAAEDATTPLVRALADRVAGLESKVAELERQRTEADRLFGSLREKVVQYRQIDVVRDGDVTLFIYPDDLMYTLTPVAGRRYALSRADYDRAAAAAHAAPAAPTDPDLLYSREASGGTLTSLLLAHYWRHGLDATVIDIGASFGLESIAAAQFIRSQGRPGTVVAFEPGVAGDLLPHNVALNAVADRVTVERSAVGPMTGPVVVYCEAGHSENNRIVNRRPDCEDRSYVVPSVALDEYVARAGIETELLVKIDTQGGEPGVLDGMPKCLARRATCLVIEFAPECLRPTGTDPAAFLARLAAHGTVLDLDQKGPLAPVADGFPIVSDDEHPGFVIRADAKPWGWCDLLVVPHTLPGRDELLATLTGPRA
jgi:FkbM family methyltransferase